MFTMTFLKIDPDGTTTAITTPKDSDAKETFRFVVDGETVNVATDVFTTGFALDVWVNDESHIREDMEHNPTASFLAGQYLKGPAVITDISPAGELLSLSARSIYLLEQTCGFSLRDNNGVAFMIETPEMVESPSAEN